jgi:DHA1 family multidrug resistance protein-like MFS transporter
MNRVEPAGIANWRASLAAATAAQFLCMVGFTTSLSFLPFYIRDVGVTESRQVELWTGVLTSVGALSMAIVSPFWGALSDRYGRKLMVERAAFGGAAVAIGMSLAGSVQHLFVLRLLHGVLTGTIPAFVTLVASIVPRSQVGFSLGMMQMAVFVGRMAGPMVGGFVADRVGYRWTFRVTAFLLLAAGMITYFLVKERFESVDGSGINKRMTAGLRTIVHSLPAMGAILAMGAIFAGYTTSHPLLPLLVEQLQPDPGLLNTATGSVYGVNAVASAVSAVLIGRLSDRAGYRNVLIACTLGTALTYAGQAISPTIGSLIIVNIATGLFAGGVLPAINAVLARHVPSEQQGAIFGVSNSVNAAGRTIGPMVGVAFAGAWGIRAAFYGAAGLFALAAGWITLVFGFRRRKHGQIDTG